MHLHERLSIVALIFVFCLALRGAERPLTVRSEPFRTPACPQAAYPDEVALFAALFAADYACTEAIAQALRPRAGSTTITALLRLIESREHALARRNALRVLGRLAEGPPGDPARELVVRHRAAEVSAALAAQLADARDSDVLQDLVWIVDTFFYPSFAVQADLERISADAGLDPAPRARAAAAAGRLIFAKQGRLPEGDLAFTLAALRSALPGVRAEAALICARLRDEQLDSAGRARVLAALNAAWQAEAPLSLAAHTPILRAEAGRDLVETTATPLTARANLVRALDRFEGTTRRFDATQAAYEALALPHSLHADDIILRSGLPPDLLPAWLAQLQQTRRAWFELVGVSTPLPDEPNETISIALFANRSAYREYMRSFVGFGADTDGLYVEARGTLYTFQRGPGESENSLDESLRHEFAHYLNGRYLFAGAWNEPGYHSEPKGWADEGLAEVTAALAFDAQGHAALAPHRRLLREVCARQLAPGLDDLLNRRVGYEQFGQFDYAAAWAFSAYLLRDRPDAARRIYGSYRAGNYRRADFAAIAAVESVAALEADWHMALRRWCES